MSHAWLGWFGSIQRGNEFQQRHGNHIDSPSVWWENFKQSFTLLLSATVGLRLDEGDENSMAGLLMIWLNMCSILYRFMQCTRLAWGVIVPVLLVDRRTYSLSKCLHVPFVFFSLEIK